MTMLQITFLFIGFFILILVLATIFKRYQRTILWTAAICMFLGVLFSVGFGYIDVIYGDVPNLPVITSIVLIIIGSALLILGAEKLYLKQREKENQSIPVVTSASNAHSADDNATGIVLTGQLKTELAEKVFAKAIEYGYMKEEGSHYKWTESKVLLAYMCGRIYCGDYPERLKMETKTYWKFGMELFPDTELCVLFATSDIGQSRQNRKDLTVPKNFQKIDIFFE